MKVHQQVTEEELTKIQKIIKKLKSFRYLFNPIKIKNKYLIDYEIEQTDYTKMNEELLNNNIN